MMIRKTTYQAEDDDKDNHQNHHNDDQNHDQSCYLKSFQNDNQNYLSLL